MSVIGLSNQDGSRLCLPPLDSFWDICMMQKGVKKRGVQNGYVCINVSKVLSEKKIQWFKKNMKASMERNCFESSSSKCQDGKH